MPTIGKVITVCLPDTVPTHLLHAAAVSAYATSTGTTTPIATPSGRYPIRKRRPGELLQPQRDVAAGGPIMLLNLDALEARAAEHAWQRWTVWSQVVRGTPPAQPFWRFVDRHRQQHTRNPYTLARAQQDYLAQPRVQAMAIYNATAEPERQIPTSELEALQVNCDSYVAVAQMRAVAADAVVTVDQTLLAPADQRLTTVHRFLQRAHTYLHTLSGAHRLVALATH
jgi:hypothetical protein